MKCKALVKPQYIAGTTSFSQQQTSAKQVSGVNGMSIFSFSTISRIVTTGISLSWC